MWSSEQVRPGIWVGFTDTTAGNLAFHVGDDQAAVAARRSSVEAALSRNAATGEPSGQAGGAFPAARLAYMNQVHGAHVAVIDSGTCGDSVGEAAPTADAMVTTPAGIGTGASPGAGNAAAGLAVMVADCVPVVLVGESSTGGPVLAVAHAGRPGVEKDVIGSVVAHMRLAGANHIEAWLGPSVCGKCYEVPESMRAAVAREVPAAHSTTSWGTPALDLPAAVLSQLAGNGATAHASGICTLEDTRYYSHRRAQRDRGVEGRFIGFVAHIPAPDRRPGPRHPRQ